ncbi:hypothetical protein ACFFLM_08925 [Deinococcus oregonensis]|uniref:Uncharacterized protein n=1 Tax=Deinococcus oregonensis TaxID=1805970 RepID=A0ABV6AX40_9DEIO
MQDVIYLLPTVAEAHPKKRAALVGILGAALARALDDQHSRAWYCKYCVGTALSRGDLGALVAWVKGFR